MDDFPDTKCNDIIDKTKDNHRQQENNLNEEQTDDSLIDLGDSFMSIISHDIRTPINSIISMATIAGKHIDNPEVVMKCINNTIITSRHMLELVNEILDIATLENSHILQNKICFNMDDMVAELHAMIISGIKTHKHTFHVNAENIVHKSVKGDLLHLKKIMINLLSNAIKYTPNGGRIEMEISEISQPVNGNCKYKFTISDNGIGMSDDFLKDMYTPFTRVRNEKTANISGSGLGMTITHNLVKIMGGTIDVKSSEGEGSTFTIILPLNIE